MGACYALKSLDLSNFNTINVTDMCGMFATLLNMEQIEFPISFDTSNVTNMEYMFEGSAFKSLDLSTFNTSNVTKMNDMFWYCENLISVNLSSFDTTKVTDMTNMFVYCDKLQTIVTPKVMGSVAASLPTTFWNGTVDVNAMAEANKTLTRHESHTYDWVTVTEASCMVDGMKKQACTVCGSENGTTETIDKLGHNLILHEAKEASCTENGFEAYETCSRCDYTTYQEIPALGHDLTHHKAKPATCTQIGWNAYETCSRCDHTTYAEIAALGHTEVVDNAVAPTCTDMGKTEGKHCSVCNTMIVAQTDVAALGHNLTQYEAKEASCTENGFEAYEICSRCDYTTYQEITALGHDLTQHKAKPATCTQNGWNAYETCSRCDHTTYAEISALGHDFESEFTIDKEASCIEIGIKSKHCTRCEEKNEVTDIALAPHTLTHIVRVEPTLQADGNIEYWTCSICNKKFLDENGEKTIDNVIIKLQLVKPNENGGENKIVVTYPLGFTPDIELVVTEIEKENYDVYQTIAQTAHGEIQFIYDVTLKSNGVMIQPNGMLTIKLYIPENLQGKSFKLFHLHEGTATNMEYILEGNYAVLKTDKLSEFIFIGEKLAPVFNPIWLILIVILAVVILGEVGFIVYRKVYKNKLSEVRR